VTSAGDTSVGANLARNGFNITGDGVKIGVLSDSYNSLSSANIDITNGDLPGIGNPDGNIKPVHVLQDFPYGQRTDEGRAMLQIIHDLAPEAELAFRTGFVSAGDFAYGILQLKDAGCDLIVDDVTYVTEPFFRDGIVSKAVDIVNNANVAFFTSAGNFGTRSYTNLFTPVTVPGITAPAHDFGSGDYRQRLRLKPGTYTIVLQWQDDVYSLGNTSAGTLNDMDFYLIDPSGTIGFNRNNIGGDPLEVLSFSINGPDPNMEVEADLMILKAGSVTGALNPVIKYIIFRGNAVIDEYYATQPLQNKSTIVGHANSTNAISVGAVLWSNTPAFGVNNPTVASFSSTGGTPVYFNGSPLVRAKPDITAPNGVNTSSTVVMGPDNDGSGNSDGYPNFFGTSAAAPHAAAVGALVLEARKKFYAEDLTPSALKYFLFNTALPMQPDGVVGGVNFKAGYGLVQTDMAIRSFANPTPFINALHYDPTIIPGQVPFTLKISGAYLTNSTIIYFRGQPIQTIVNSSLDTLSGEIPTFTGNPAINVYTPPFPGAIGDGGLSNTLYFFSGQKDTVTIVVDNKQKTYGEPLPTLTTTILLNGDSLQHYNQQNNTNITPADLGLSTINIRYTNPDMNPLTDVGTYQIRASRTFDTTNINDIGLLERYVYDSVFGNLQINKLLVTVQPQDTTIEYGEPLTNFTFNYLVDSNVTISNQDSLIAAIELSHNQYMNDDALGLINADGSGQIVIYNGKILPVFNSPSVIIDGKLYPVINGNGGTAVVLLNGQEYPVTNGNGGTAVVLLNGQEYPVINGNGGTAIVLLNGQIYPVLFNAAGNPYIQYNGTQYPVTNGNGGTAVVLLNGQELPVLNSKGGTAVVLLNGEYYAVFNGNGGTAVILLNGTEYPVVNSKGGTAVVLLNGQEIPVLNGSGGTAVVLLNGVEYPVINGSGGTAVILLNGQEVSVVNGNGGTAVVLLNGTEYPVVNGKGGTAVVLLNGQMHPILNGNGGTAVVLLNGEQIPLVNGKGGTAVVLLNGEIYPVFNGNGGTAVILLNGQEIPVVNGNGGTAVVLLNGQEIPVVNSISPEVLTNMSILSST
ncbi:MAG TPA: S8 family serine peptidase, partial [Chitinophagaceae bacterium]